MEGSESEAVFDSMNLNPRLFINEVLNSVDDLLDGAFHFFQQEASKLLNTDGTDRSEELNKGVSHVRNMIQAVLDKRLGMWEKYCLRHCFVVPEGFTLPKVKESPGDDLINEGAFCHPELHAQLDSLRKKLYEVQKESSELNRELHTLERQNHLSNSCAASVKEALKLYEQNSVHDMFEEMIKTASELRKKTEKLKLKSTEESELVKKEMIYDPNGVQSVMHHNIGISSMELEELQEFVVDMEKM